MKREIVLLALVWLLISIVSTDVLAQCPGETKLKVETAINSIYVEKSFAPMSRQLREIGSPAAPCVLDYVRREGYQRPIIKLVLLSFVSESEGTEVESALIEMLKDKQPELRGYAVNELGKRKVKRAVPFLIERLDDNGNTVILCSMNSPCDDVFVRDLVVEALESITGVRLTKSKNREKQVKAWRRWWQKQQNPT